MGDVARHGRCNPPPVRDQEMSRLRVRTYDVRFGDASLVTGPDADPTTGTETERHVLIDVGTVPSRTGDDHHVLAPVLEDVMRVLDGKRVDLYVMTHEHLDHAHGLFYGDARLHRTIAADWAWLTASAEDGYYDAHPEAKRARAEHRAVLAAAAAHVEALPADEAAPFRSILANNDPSCTSECIDYLRTIADPSRTT